MTTLFLITSALPVRAEDWQNYLEIKCGVPCSICGSQYHSAEYQSRMVSRTTTTSILKGVQISNRIFNLGPNKQLEICNQRADACTICGSEWHTADNCPKRPMPS